MTAILLVVSLVLGLAVGSFLNVVVHRVPRKLSVIHPRSSCVYCATPIEPLDNVPVLSWLLLRGRCRHCRHPISPRYPAIEALTASLFLVLALRFGASPDLPAMWLLAATLVAISAIDLELYIVPKRVVYMALLGSGLLLSLAAATDGSWRRLWEAAAGSAIAFLALFLIHLVSPRGMGFGDVRLAGLLGVFLGWMGLEEVAVGLFLSFLLGAVFGIALIVFAGRGRRSKLPFAPFLSTGCLGGVIWGTQLARLWLG